MSKEKNQNEPMNLTNISTYQAVMVQSSAHRLLQKLCDDILMPFDITKAQWTLIGAVKDHGKDGARLSDLAKEIGTSLPFLTNSINLLESKGILKRKDNKDDNRSKKVVVTTKFLRKCDDIETALRQGLRESIYSRIDPYEFRVYMKVLYELVEVGQEHLDDIDHDD